MKEQAQTMGGERLRALRLKVGKTQLLVELEAELGSGYLQRVESGKVVQPERGTLERILNALAVTYRERVETMELFGYTTSRPLPTEREAAKARAACKHELQEVGCPAYLLDCASRLLAWNSSMAALVGGGLDESVMEQLASRPLIPLWFDVLSQLGMMVCEPETFYPSVIRALRHEARSFQHESWWLSLLAQWRRDIPLFREYWDRKEQPRSASALRTVASVKLRTLHSGVLQFRLSAEHFTHDPRFRIVYFVPADEETMHWCTACVTSTRSSA